MRCEFSRATGLKIANSRNAPSSFQYMVNFGRVKQDYPSNAAAGDDTTRNPPLQRPRTNA